MTRVYRSWPIETFCRKSVAAVYARAPLKSRMSVSCRLLKLSSADECSFIAYVSFPNSSVSRNGDVKFPLYCVRFTVSIPGNPVAGVIFTPFARF